jgi:hypothetical protein
LWKYSQTSKDQDISIDYPNDLQVLYSVTFSNNLAWANYYGFKVDQGVWEDQTIMRFETGIMYNAAIGLDIHHKVCNLSPRLASELFILIFPIAVGKHIRQ